MVFISTLPSQNRGMRMIEGGHINRSLLALANCINALTTGHHNFVNYRDSKLLKEALGGNCMYDSHDCTHQPLLHGIRGVQKHTGLCSED